MHSSFSSIGGLFFHLFHQFTSCFFRQSEQPRVEKILVDVLLQVGSWTAKCFFLSAAPGGLTSIASDPVKAVGDAVDGSANLVSTVLKFAASLVAPDEDDGTKVAHVTVKWHKASLSKLSRNFHTEMIYKLNCLTRLTENRCNEISLFGLVGLSNFPLYLDHTKAVVML